jgi:hypothetical protein
VGVTQYQMAAWRWPQAWGGSGRERTEPGGQPPLGPGDTPSVQHVVRLDRARLAPKQREFDPVTPQELEPLHQPVPGLLRILSGPPFVARKETCGVLRAPVFRVCCGVEETRPAPVQRRPRTCPQLDMRTSVRYNALGNRSIETRLGDWC